MSESTATTIRRTTFTEPSDREVVATRVFDAPRQLVWDAHTKCEHLQKWQLGPDDWTMPVCEMDARPGGTYRYVWSGPGGDSFEFHGEIREVVPPERLVNTEEWGEEWPPAVDTLTLVEDAEGRTMLTVKVEYASHDVRERAKETGMEEGWAQSYDRLDEHLRTMR